MRRGGPHDLTVGAWALLIVLGSKFILSYWIPEPHGLVIWGVIAFVAAALALTAMEASARYELRQPNGNPPKSAGSIEALIDRGRLGWLTRLPILVLGAGALGMAWYLWSLPTAWARDTYDDIGWVFVVAVVLMFTALIGSGFVCLWVAATGCPFRLRRKGDQHKRR